VSWDYGFFLPTSKIFRSQSVSAERELPMETAKEAPIVSCFACGEPLGVVSRSVYVVDEKSYCVKCYQQILLSVRTARVGIKSSNAQNLLVV
jgi:formylmethanofuran dehydrogenase subunit E